MNKIFLLLAVFLASYGCASPGGPVPTTTCSGTTHGPSDVDISYRVDDRFSVTMKLKNDTRNSSEFWVKLNPQGRVSRDVVITTKGVSGTLPDGTSTPFAWLDDSGSWNSTNADGRKIILCVPDGVPAGTWYKFDVRISGKDGTGVIGSIDPRIDVL